MTLADGVLLLFYGIILTVFCFYMGLKVLPKYFNNEEEKEEPKERKKWYD